jgi:hypothetical protein
VSRRAEILTIAQSQGLNVSTLQELAASLDDSQGQLVNAAKVLKRKMEAMYYASLSHWISCQKAWLHYSELAQLIANGGKKPMLPGSARYAAQGGAILDAKV